MLEINHIIQELLQLHDCVIFPNLGGFVAQYSPSNFDEKNLFYLLPISKFYLIKIL